MTKKEIGRGKASLYLAIKLYAERLYGQPAVGHAKR